MRRKKGNKNPEGNCSAPKTLMHRQPVNFARRCNDVPSDRSQGFQICNFFTQKSPGRFEVFSLKKGVNRERGNSENQRPNTREQRKVAGLPGQQTQVTVGRRRGGVPRSRGNVLNAYGICVYSRRVTQLRKNSELNSS